MFLARRFAEAGEKLPGGLSSDRRKGNKPKGLEWPTSLIFGVDADGDKPRGLWRCGDRPVAEAPSRSGAPGSSRSGLLPRYLYRLLDVAAGSAMS